MPCSTPECTNDKLLARGLCGPCYHRLRRSGSVLRQYVVNSGTCSVEGCGKPSFAKNLCQHHYARAQHPLNHSWRLLRSRSPGQYPPGWDRFETFLAEVGERPTPDSQLRRADPALPWGASNIRWVAPLRPGAQYYSPEKQATYGREWNLQKKFGLTSAEYDAMLAAQGGVCAICGGKETHVHKSGKLKDLAVDHDHETGQVRGLLCMNHNQGIGRFQNDPALLRAAADYLERHAAPKLACDAVKPNCTGYNIQTSIVLDAPHIDLDKWMADGFMAYKPPRATP
jgi:hypothetical protein